MNHDEARLDCDAIKQLMTEEPEKAKAIVEMMKEVDELEAECDEILS
jgi:hypothetical protein